MQGVYRTLYRTPDGGYWSVFNGIPYRWIYRARKWHTRRMKKLPPDAHYIGHPPPRALLSAIGKKCREGNSVWKYNVHRCQRSVKGDL